MGLGLEVIAGSSYTHKKNLLVPTQDPFNTHLRPRSERSAFHFSRGEARSSPSKRLYMDVTRRK